MRRRGHTFKTRKGVAAKIKLIRTAIREKRCERAAQLLTNLVWGAGAAGDVKRQTKLTLWKQVKECHRKRGW